MENVHIENDKIQAPFLLAASFNGFIGFIGSRSEHNILYWEFAPKDKVEDLISKFQTKREPHIPAKDLFEAIETFWKQVSELKKSCSYD